MCLRLKPMMSNLLSYTQGAFIVGRDSLDNTFIGHEILHSSITKDKRLVNGKPYVAIKLDMPQAYDKISRDFIKQTLTTLSFMDEFINLIMRCVTSTSMGIRFNGCISQNFKPSRILRQGNPLSPLNFNLCMSMLSSLNKDTSLKGFWKGIAFNNQTPHITHLHMT